MERPFKIAIVGAGASGAMHASALRETPDVELAAVADVDLPRARAFAAQWGIPSCHGPIEDLLADPDIDSIHICTPPFLHEPQAVAALAAGKHVLVEKPLARTVVEADRIIAASARSKGFLGGVFQHRFMDLPLQVKRAVEEGRLGSIYLADAYVKWWRDDDYYRASPWRGTRAFEGGGAMINQGIHTIDLLLWLAGPVVEVSGSVATVAHPIEMEDVAVATLRFASGAIGVIEATTVAWPGFAERIELHGAGGSIILDEGKGTIDWLLRGDEARQTSEVGTRGTGAADPMSISMVGHPAQFRAFYSAIREGRRPSPDGLEVRQSLELIEAIGLSSARRAPVTLPLKQ